MTNPSIADNNPPRRSRARRREAMINAVATVLGCMALVVMLATVVRVVMVKLWESARVNPEYVQSVYASDTGSHWSGNIKEQPALLAEENETAPTNLTSEAPASSSLLTLGAPPASEKAAVGAAPPTTIQDIDSKRPKIETTLRSFFAAADVDAKLAFSRDPQRVRPLMTQYYSQHPHDHLEWKALGWVLPVNEPGFRLGYAQAIFANAEPVSLIIEETEGGDFRVDWESSVRYGELDWSEFIQTQPASPKLFRVTASRPQHTPPNETPQGSEVLEIKHPGENDVIYAWFDRADPKFQPLLQQLQTGNWKDVPLTLRLCYPGPAGSGKSAQIADVEGKGWLILQGTRS